MDGRGYDQISINITDQTNSQTNKTISVDRYSGAEILISSNQLSSQSKPYYFIADRFSTSKLKPDQRSFMQNLTKDCTLAYDNYDLKVYECK